MRGALVVIHRWFGLFTAVFLFVSGLTGAVISWDHELDAWLNPLFYEAQSELPQEAARDPIDIVEALEANDPRFSVVYTPLSLEPHHALQVFVEPRVDPKTQQPYELDFNQMAVDPASGRVQARRMWGDVSLARENILPFLYKLHYSMHIPDGFGVEVGMVFMGLVAMVWTIDCFVALWLSFPNRKTWRKSFAFRLREGRAKLEFDLHRSGGVWMWLFMLILAVTAVSMNLRNEVVRPIVSLFSPLSEDPFASRPPKAPEEYSTPGITRRQAIELAQVEAQKRGITAPVGGLSYLPAFNLYAVGFFEAGQDHGDGGLGNPWLYFDATDGRPIGNHIPGEGSLGDLFMQAQFPLHSGRILGLPGRILVSFLGLVVATLSVTGVSIWARRRRARVLKAKKLAREERERLAAEEAPVTVEAS